MASPEIGDHVHLWFDDTYHYILKVAVTSVTDTEVIGDVIGLYDRDNNGWQITGGETFMQYNGTSIKAQHQYVHKVLKKPY